jgi:hypothetical protein
MLVIVVRLISVLVVSTMLDRVIQTITEDVYNVIRVLVPEEQLTLQVIVRFVIKLWVAVQTLMREVVGTVTRDSVLGMILVFV